MTTPLTTWTCDHCGEQIESADQGYVIWQTAERRYSGFKIIHKRLCDDKTFPLSLGLKDFVGERGLTMLTTFLSAGPIKGALGRDSRCQIDELDMDEFVDFFRRVQIPYYEEARSKFSEPALLDDLHDDNELRPYLAESLKDIAGRY